MQTSGQGAGDRQRRIALPGTLNLRDLGGYPTSDGGALRWRTLLRSDALSWLDDTGRAALASLGLRTVIDLRTDEEARDAPSVLHGVGAQTYRIPLFTAGALGHLPPQLAAVYRYMVDERGPAIAAAVGRLCRREALPALIHCSAGKDRTGLVVAIVLAIAGVADETIAEDYSMSASYLDPGAASVLSRIRAIGRPASRLDLGVLGAPPQLILDALAQVRAQAGTVAGYLARHGLPEESTEALRAALVAR